MTIVSASRAAIWIRKPRKDRHLLRQHNYPQANNVAEVKEYDFDGSLQRRSTISYVTGSYQTNTSIHLLGLPLQQSVYASNARPRSPGPSTNTMFTPTTATRIH